VTGQRHIRQHGPPDPIWNGGEDDDDNNNNNNNNNCPAYTSVSIFRQASFTDVSWLLALGYVTAHSRTVQFQFLAGIFGILLFSDDTHGLTYCVMCVGVFF